MKFQKYIYLFTIILTLSACKNEVNNTPEIVKVDTTQSGDLDVSEKSNVSFKDNRVTTVFKLYNAVRAALVNTNSGDASQYAGILLKSEIMQEADDETKNALESIINAKDIKEQRTHFVTVTNTIEKIVAGNIESGALYKQFCPMAFGNKGAYWISDSKEIRNPYFGDKMLKCGRIDAELK